MSTPADRLKAARIAAGYTSATDAAKAFGWTVSTYLGHENGSRGLPVDAAQRYARAFKVGWERLLAGDDAKSIHADFGTPIIGVLGSTKTSTARDEADLLPVGAEGYDFQELVAFVVEYGRENHYFIASTMPNQRILVGDEVVVSTDTGNGEKLLSSWIITENEAGEEVYIQNIGPRTHAARLLDMATFFGQPGLELEGVVVATYVDKRRRKAIEAAGFSEPLRKTH